MEKEVYFNHFNLFLVIHVLLECSFSKCWRNLVNFKMAVKSAPFQLSLQVWWNKNGNPSYIETLSFFKTEDQFVYAHAHSRGMLPLLSFFRPGNWCVVSLENASLKQQNAFYHAQTSKYSSTCKYRKAPLAFPSLKN